MNKKILSLLVLVLFSKSLFAMGGRCFYGPAARAVVEGTVPAHGAAIQELTRRLNDKDTEIAALRADLNETRNLLQSMRQQGIVPPQPGQPAAQRP